MDIVIRVQGFRVCITTGALIVREQDWGYN